MTDINALHRAAAAARTARDAARASVREGALRLHEIQRELADAHRGEPEREQANRRQNVGRVARLEREQAGLRATVDAAARELAKGREHTTATLRDFFRDPESLVSQLDDASPFLLFPVRIETKFSSTQNGGELRVRIFPDDVAVAHFEKVLTVNEKEAGEKYWRARAAANAAAGVQEREELGRGAWNLLASRYTSYRAGWITQSTKPVNWAASVTDPTTLVFPVIETKPLAWSEAPRSPVMPDVFAVVLERGKDSRTEFGKLVPDDLPLGPDPLQVEGFLTRDATTQRLKISSDLLWLIDFAAAEAVGMGVRIPLTAAEATEGFDRILVLGLRLSTSGHETSGLLSSLIESHRYSQGMSIVPQGAPTNNTDDAASGLTTAHQSVDETYGLELDVTPFPLSSAPMTQLDGERLASVLGVPVDAIRALPNARRADVAESVAMNRALWNATLGHFVTEMLEGTFSPADIARVRTFLTEFVHGRGLAPAIRVGAQPYGVVITSSFDDWQWSEIEHGDDGDFWDRLRVELGFLRKHWQTVVEKEVSYVGKRDAKGVLIDPFKTLINIIGLQASSVEFWSRTGVPQSYFKALTAYADNDPEAVQEWILAASMLRSMELFAARLPSSKTASIAKVLFMEKAERVTMAIVDGDPALPLSEVRTIRPFDGVSTHNYIHWLATASSADIQDQNFTGADGKLVPPPDALLYKLLRVAAIDEITTSSRWLTERVRADVFVGAPAIGDAPNIAEPVLMPAHFAMVDTAKIGVTRHSTTTGDYLLDHARSAAAVVQKPPEAAALTTLTEALRVLADLPTARLERLLAEHIDIVSYRLDAWLTGMFARRLWDQRRKQKKAPGTYLGSYGWVLDVRPEKDRRVVAPTEIPAELTAAVDGPVVSHANNGGFVQAPSLPQAVTAAVLRNAYLTHAETAVADRMSVNLSSARVRTALSYIEGLRNGQELGALLGYQLERGLHENHPGVELDAFIYTLRARFPLVSKKLTPTPDGQPAEVVEARNVVNGYDLLDFAKSKKYPYDIEGLPSALGTAVAKDQAAAIATEVDRLRDSMDAIADLLLAESVHQVVQGNYARARGAVQALTDGEFPPLPDVIQTPRMGKSLTHRVALFLDPAAIGGWQPVLTPRAAANAPLNHWLTTVLPPPGDIQWMVKAGAAAPEFPTVAKLGLEPLDLVLLSGERVGDLTSTVEQLMVRDFRNGHGITDDVATYAFKKPDPSVPDAKSLVFDPDAAQPGKHSLGSLLPLLKALRHLVTGGRPLGAKDLMCPTEAQDAHPENPNGYDGTGVPLKDLAELKGRIENAHSALAGHHAALTPLIVAMKPLADALDADPKLAAQAGWSVLIPALRNHLRAIALFGMPEALPADGFTLSRALVSTEFAQAEAVQRSIAQKLAEARTLLDIAFATPLPSDAADAARALGGRVTARFESYSQAARVLLGPEYVAVPLFAAHAEGAAELASATATPIESDALVIESWLQSAARVRPPLQAWDMLATYHDWLREASLPFVAVQLPAAPGAKWIGGVFDDTVAADDVVSIAMHGAPATYAVPLAGLLVDEWTELVPSANETIGIAMHINRPNAVAPQALLLAVAPRQSGTWAWSDLIAILHDTMDRMQLRAVEPDDIKRPYFQLLPPIVAHFDESMLTAAAKFSGIRIEV